LSHFGITTERRSKSQTLRPWHHGSPPPSVLGDSFYRRKSVAQDFTGVPLGVDLGDAISRGSNGKSPSIIEPLVPEPRNRPLRVDFASQADAFKLNLEMEFKRNSSRYQFLKWCMESFKSFDVNTAGDRNHQVNLSTSLGVLEKDGVYYPDTLVGWILIQR